MATTTKESLVVTGRGAVQVLIRIIEEKGAYKLDFQPKAAVTIYYKVPGQVHNPNLPSQVQWAVSGLEDGQHIYITAKPDARFGYMRSECYGPISDPTVALPSGQPLRGPATHDDADKVVWKYNVILTDALGRKLASYDPDVIIDKDP